MDKVKQELQNLQDTDIIMHVEHPTEWCAPIVVVPKANGRVRLCIDLTWLNDSVLRERHQLPSVDYTLAQMAGARYFSKIDANSGFHQIKLSEDSAYLTTFITPFGRFCFKRLPFGISSGPEIFQREISKILDGLMGVVCMMDDIVVFGSTREEHDKRLCEVLTKLQVSGLTLNKEKCRFRESEIEFLGQIISSQGIKMDSSKIKAILEMPEPQDVPSLRRFMGMVNQLGKFTKGLTDLTEPMRGLLSTKTDWHWSIAQSQAFQATKSALTSAPTLAFYDSSAETKISADSSSYGLGAVLLQKHQQAWHPVAFASRSLTPTERRYAQIEKEALAATWASEKFSDYVIGKPYVLETDHKPLIALLGSKDIDQLPVRIQRFRMRLMRYEYKIVHVPGKELYTADALSRAPLTSMTADDTYFQQEVKIYANFVMTSLPASDQKLDFIRRHQEEDEVCRQLRTYVEEVWPEKHKTLRRSTTILAIPCRHDYCGWSSHVWLQNLHPQRSTPSDAGSYTWRSSRNSKMPCKSSRIHLVAGNKPTDLRPREKLQGLRWNQRKFPSRTSYPNRDAAISLAESGYWSLWISANSIPAHCWLFFKVYQGPKVELYNFIGNHSSDQENIRSSWNPSDRDIR